MLGAKIGHRVNIDFFDCVEFDLIEVGDEVVFGSCVVLAPADDADASIIKIDHGANVLDHSVLLGGVVVERHAVTGTCTLGPKDHVFPATSISTGRVRGAPVLLKYQGDVEAGTSKLPERDRDRVLAALAAHRDPVTFYAFNCFCAGAALALEPAQALLELVPVLALWFRPASVRDGALVAAVRGRRRATSRRRARGVAATSTSTGVAATSMISTDRTAPRPRPPRTRGVAATSISTDPRRRRDLATDGTARPILAAAATRPRNIHAAPPTASPRPAPDAAQVLAVVGGRVRRVLDGRGL